MKHFSDDGCTPQGEWDSPCVSIVSEEDREYYDWLNSDKSMFATLDYDPMDDYESTIKHFQD